VGCFRVVLFAQRFQDLGLRHVVVIPLLDLDRLVLVLQRVIKIDLVGEQIVGSVVPCVPGILRDPSHLLLQASLDDRVHVNRDFEGYRHLLPSHRDDGGIIGRLIDVVSKGFMEIHRLGLHGYPQCVF